MSKTRRLSLTLGVLLACLGLAMSAAAYRFGQPDGPILYWGVLPGAPFMLLAVLSLTSRISLRALAGAAVGALLAVAMPYGLLWYASANYSGGGANIGLGLLLLSLPVYLPIAMLVGACVGQFLIPTREDTNALRDV